MVSIANDDSDEDPYDFTITGIGRGAPVADAGPDQNAATEVKIDLDGSDSYDLDGQPLTFLWTLESKPAGSALTEADIEGKTTPNPSFTPEELHSESAGGTGGDLYFCGAGVPGDGKVLRDEEGKDLPGRDGVQGEDLVDERGDERERSDVSPAEGSDIRDLHARRSKQGGKGKEGSEPAVDANL
ncbi:MAG: hypothetical protein FJY85_11280 [Deltaproteobacteria bacterium]|nr:hypothetical protein [Deltaproteobacteria bacterium]